MDKFDSAFRKRLKDEKGGKTYKETRNPFIIV